jgi:hypothetical protein
MTAVWFRRWQRRIALKGNLLMNGHHPEARCPAEPCCPPNNRQADRRYLSFTGGTWADTGTGTGA